MRILAIYKYYWPDTTPYARILKTILENWVNEGHECRVLSAQPGYNDIVHPPQPCRETLGGVQVERLRIVRERKHSPLKRLTSFLTFLGQAAWRACTGPRTDLIIVNPHPPVLMGLTVRLIKLLRGIPYIYHCEDIHPESALCTGQVRLGTGYRLLRWQDTASCRAAGLIVTLSQDMAGTLVERGIERDRIAVINNFILGRGEEPARGDPFLPTVVPDAADSFVLLFAGNIGRFQGLEHFVQTARLLADRPDIKFLFMGEGAAKAGLQATAGDLVGRTVFFCPFQPLAVARQAMGEADLGLISLQRGVYRVAYPSKTMMYLAAGLPVLTVVENESILTRDIMTNELGYGCAPGDHAATAAAIRDACDRRQTWRSRRPQIAKWAENEFGPEAILARWTAIPERAAAGSSRGN